MSLTLHGYFRSTATWRVRIALGLKSLHYENVFHHLRRREQRAPSYLALNPQGLLPTLELGDGRVLTQSLAICEYLDSVHPEPPLLPQDPFERACVRAFAGVIACDIHPVQNLKILERLRGLGLENNTVESWARETISEGLEACAVLIGRNADTPFCFGERPSLADLCLAPQLGNARRFGVDLDRWPRLMKIEKNCDALSAFRAASPSNQPDAE
jgi:maleylpyruvate isomerase